MKDYRYNRIGDILVERALESPTKTGFEFVVDDKVLSIDYITLYQKASFLAHKMLEKAQPGDRALLIYAPGLDFVVAFYACTLSGIIAVPSFPPLNANFSKKLTMIIKDCYPKLVLTTQDLHWKFLAARFLAKIKRFAKPFGLFKNIDEEFFTLLGTVRTMTTDGLGKSHETPSLEHFPRFGSDHISFLQYTSGTTDIARGVMVTHQNIISNCDMLLNVGEIESGTGSVIWEPHYHDMGLIMGCVCPLFVGGVTRTMSPFDFIKSPIKWIKQMSETKAFLGGGPNFCYNLCLKISDEELDALNLDLSHWKRAFCSAEPIQGETLRKFAEKFAKYQFSSSAFSPGYGLAENTVFVTVRNRHSAEKKTVFDKIKLFHHEIAELTSNEKEGVELVTCGGWSEDLDMKIIDPNTLQVLPDRHIGKVVMKSDSVALGYWEKPELTKKMFKLKLENGNEYMDTGDQGFIFNGELFITGRFKEILIIHGINYSPHPIEQTIEKISPIVRPGCVAVIQMTNLDLDSISAVVEVKSQDQQELEELCQQIQEKILKDFSLFVREIYCVQPKFISKTTSGKIIRHTLQNELRMKSGVLYIYQGKKNVASHVDGELNHEDMLFEDIATLANSLNLGEIRKSDRVQDVFDDSLRLMQLLSQLEYSLNSLNMPFSLLNSGSTFHDLIHSAMDWSQKHPSAREVITSSAPSATEHLIAPPMAQMIANWMGQKEFNLGYVCDLTESMSFQSLQESIEKLLQIQPYLNSYYSFERQLFVCDREIAVNSVLERLQINLPEEEMKGYLEACIQSLSQNMDITKPPLFKVLFVENSKTGKSYVVLVMSHLIADPYSMWLWFDQIETIYKGSVSHTRKLKKQIVADLANIQEAWSSRHEDLLTADYDFLRKAAAETKETEESFSHFHIDRSTVNWLENYAREENVKMDSILMGLIHLSLKGCGRNDHTMQFVHHGRTLVKEEHPIRNLIGWFTLGWPVPLPNWEGDLGAYLRKMNELNACSQKEWMEKKRTLLFANMSPIEYSHVPLQHFRTKEGLFATSTLFFNDYFHGKTFATKLPRYREIFIRPVLINGTIDVLFFANRGVIYPDQLAEKFIANLAELRRYEENKLRQVA